MKPRDNPLKLRSAVVSACSLIALSISVSATSRTWVGDVDNNFMNGANWATDPALPSLSADTWQINGLGSLNTNPTLNVSSPLTFTGTSGKIAFGASAPAMTLSGSAITLFNGTGDAILIGAGSTVTQTVASNLVLGDGAASTISLSNNSTSGSLLKITGSITGGSGSATPGALVLSFGSTSNMNGNYEVSGNITKGGASALAITKRGSGTLTLSGTNAINNLNFGTTAASGDLTGLVRVTGGITSLNVTESTAGWGTGSGTNTVQISGGEVNATAGRGIRTSIQVDGGKLNFITGTGRLSFGTGANLSISSGEVNYNVGVSGVRLGNSSGNSANQAGTTDFTATQTGGTFKILGGGAATSTLMLGGSDGGKSVAYNLSGGTLDVRGSDDTNGHIVLGADTGATGTTTLSLSGSGKLISRFNPGASSGGIAGSQVGAVQVLSLTGGTLVAGRIDATNLRGSVGGTNGILVNNGTAFAPGDVGTIGRTSIIGNMSVSSGSLTIDLGGLTASSVFSQAANSGSFDNLLITGDLALGGTLGLNLVNGYVPQFTDVFKIIDITGNLSNFFTNVTNGGFLNTLGNEGSFKVYASGNDVYLTNYSAVPEPGAALLGGLGVLALLRRRR